MTTSCILRTIFAAFLLSIHQSRAAEALSVEGPLEPNEADRLAKELANRISPLINIPFQANEDSDTVRRIMATDLRSTSNRSFPFRSAKIGI